MIVCILIAVARNTGKDADTFKITRHNVRGLTRVGAPITGRMAWRTLPPPSVHSVTSWPPSGSPGPRT